MTGPVNRNDVPTESERAAETSQFGARRAAGNIASLLTTNVVNRGANFVVYALVARHLGAYEFGQLALAAALLLAWQRVSLLGLKTFIVRQVAKDHQSTWPSLIHATAICLCSSILGMAAMLPFLKLMNYSPETSRVILVLFVGLPPFVLSEICEGVFQGRERMELITITMVPIKILMVIATYVLLSNGALLESIAWTLVLSHVCVLALQWIVLFCCIAERRLSFDPRIAFTMVRSSSVLFGVQTSIAIRNSATAVILSKMAGEASVGLYTAAAQLLVPLGILFDNVTLGVFPVMCRNVGAGMANLRIVVRRTIEGLMAFALPSVVGLFILADAIMVTIYQKPEYLVSADVLRVIVLLPLQGALTTVMGQALWASERERVSLNISVINTVIKLILSVVFIFYFGLLGAAISAVLAAMINLIQHYIPVAQLLKGIHLPSLLWKPVIASAAMAAFLIAYSGLNLVVAIVSAAGVYGLVLTGLFVVAAGGLGPFRLKCSQLLAS